MVWGILKKNIAGCGNLFVKKIIFGPLIVEF